MTQVKICGLSEPETLTTAIESGADFIGLVFYEPSPRHVDIEVATYLAKQIPSHVEVVGLFVNPTDDYLKQVLDSVPLTMIQLHGDETVHRTTKIKQRFGLPIMKALSIETIQDLLATQEYEGIVDWLLFDACPSTCPQAGGQGEKLPGGNGIPFDWNILTSYRSTTPWMLGGGLTPDNVQKAITQVSPLAVDVSSGVESTRGVKDADKIHSFISRAKKA